MHTVALHLTGTESSDLYLRLLHYLDERDLPYLTIPRYHVVLWFETYQELPLYLKVLVHVVSTAQGTELRVTASPALPELLQVLRSGWREGVRFTSLLWDHLWSVLGDVDPELYSGVTEILLGTYVSELVEELRSLFSGSRTTAVP